MIDKIKNKAKHYWMNHKVESIVFVGFLCKAIGPHTIENRVKRIYNSLTKTKNK